MLVRLVGQFFAFMSELDEGFVTVSRHQEVDLYFDIVKIQCDSTIFFSLLIFVDYVEFLKDLDKVGYILFGHVFDTKFVHD